MKYTYNQQAQSIKGGIDAIETLAKVNNWDMVETLEALKEAATTVLAVNMIGEDTILQTQKLNAIAREIVAMVDENEGTIYDDQAVALRTKLKKILNLENATRVLNTNN